MACIPILVNPSTGIDWWGHHLLGCQDVLVQTRIGEEVPPIIWIAPYSHPSASCWSKKCVLPSTLATLSSGGLVSPTSPTSPHCPPVRAPVSLVSCSSLPAGALRSCALGTSPIVSCTGHRPHRGRGLPGQPRVLG